MSEGLFWIGCALIISVFIGCITKCSSDTDKNRMECLKIGKKVEECKELFHN